MIYLFYLFVVIVLIYASLWIASLYSTKIYIESHWDHWREHIIIIGTQLVNIGIGSLDYAGIGISFLGIEVKIVNTKISNWILVKLFKIDKSCLVVSLKIWDSLVHPKKKPIDMLDDFIEEAKRNPVEILFREEAKEVTDGL